MQKLSRVWVGNDTDPCSGFSLYLDPMALDDCWKQAEELLMNMPAFDSVILFDAENDDVPVWSGVRVAPGVIKGFFGELPVSVAKVA